jgi:hypothetical protein
VIIEPRFSPDQRRQINDLPPVEVLAKDSRVMVAVMTGWSSPGFGIY